MTMTDHLDQWELDVIPPLGSVTITLCVSPPELELAVATSGVSLLPRHDESDRRRHGRRRDIAARAVLTSRVRFYRRESLRLLALTWLR
jgi:hypothetical protein